MEVWLGIDASGSRSVLLAVDSAMNIIHTRAGRRTPRTHDETGRPGFGNAVAD